ncbi:uncharacterized protein SCHCODRAFT_02502932 [Schizophyllum commune H4-8]|nr:uncharacterized protein SCHCODRAFT_02502932 [Schizophyllum commune H4-8]KAI5892060.1 hypothetical protein SCHCODRAFT_02502932 [Schizophyllum commune H4-8]
MSKTEYPPQAQQPMSIAQVGEQYQAELFAKCAQGSHVVKKHYGTCGIVWAIVCFPLGLICLCRDREKRCVRCNVRID